MTQVIPADSRTESDTSVAFALMLEAIAGKTGDPVRATSLRMRIGRLVRYHPLNQLLDAITVAPKSLGTPMLVRFCERQVHPRRRAR